MLELEYNEFMEIVEKNPRQQDKRILHYLEEGNQFTLFIRSVDYWEYFTVVPKSVIQQFGEQYEASIEEAVRDFKRSILHDAVPLKEKKEEILDLPDTLTKGRVIAIGPRGGRIVGYIQGKPIYEGSPEDKKRQARRREKEEEKKQNAFFEGYEKHTQAVVSDLKKNFKDRNVYGRTKDKMSALEKLKRKPDLYPNLNSLKDMTGVRVESNTISDIYTDVAKIKEKHNVIDEKDYIKNPKGNYRSYHIITEKEGKFTEIQVRTKNMTKFADYMHDSVYKVGANMVEVVESNKEKINEYVTKLGNYFHSLDTGTFGIDFPNCPDVIRVTVGCFN